MGTVTLTGGDRLHQSAVGRLEDGRQNDSDGGSCADEYVRREEQGECK